ncbi:protein zyg-11 homolog B-like isoform X1 [Patella vulgata]|uniref:protein zyg-11 homolog B-like isoform X1 n=1 Tax=Patella vulgata TaxID=6465 RepID=UPI00217FF360|nr:protein zyg-11 homolog B-like isoform X1 [Patella vulgata]
MYAQPNTLRSSCICFICDNIQSVCRLQSSNSGARRDDYTEEPLDRDLANRLDSIELKKERQPNQLLKDSGPDSTSGDTFRNEFGPTLTTNIQYAFSDPDVHLPHNISEQLLERLSDIRKLNDSTIKIFQPQNTTLRRLVIKNAIGLTPDALGILKKHKILDIEIVHQPKININKLLECLGEWTIRNLRTLNVEGILFTPNNNFDLLSKLRTLRSLNVSDTEFNNEGLDVIARELNCLENIDISLTKVTDVSPLRKCKENIKVLAMFGVQVSDPEKTGSILLELTKLVYLDVASLLFTEPMHLAIVKIMTTKDAHPCLSSLDISNNCVPEDVIRLYLKSHSKMKFLGLVESDTKYSDEFLNALQDSYPDLTFAALGNGKQIINILKRYRNRYGYLLSSMNAIYMHSQYGTGWDDIEEVVRVIIKSIHANVLHREMVYPLQQGTEYALGIKAISCIYNLLEDDNCLRVHPTCRREAVECVLQIMSKAIIVGMFDNRYYNLVFVKLLKQVMFNDEKPFYEKNCGYIRTLMRHIKHKITRRMFNEELKCLTRIFWNVTDEAPGNCKIIVRENGMEVLMDLLQVLSGHPPYELHEIHSSIINAALGTLNNIAEVKELRKEFMKDNFIELVTHLLDSDQPLTGYSSAGILANLISGGDELWTTNETLQKSCSDKLMTTVLNWEKHRGGLVKYESFCPLFQLLKCYHIPAVQLWAAWAIEHVCGYYANRYCPLLVKEGGKEILERTLKNSTSIEVKKLVLDIRQHLNNFVL